jgi:hypothetical protein
MKKPLKKNVLKALFLLTLLSSLLQSYAYAQATKGNVADAVKEARTTGVSTATLNHLLRTRWILKPWCISSKF